MIAYLRDRVGAGGGNRTHTTLLESSDFKSDASASSATPAHVSAYTTPYAQCRAPVFNELTRLMRFGAERVGRRLRSSPGNNCIAFQCGARSARQEKWICKSAFFQSVATRVQVRRGHTADGSREHSFHLGTWGISRLLQFTQVLRLCHKRGGVRGFPPPAFPSEAEHPKNRCLGKTGLPRTPDQKETMTPAPFAFLVITGTILTCTAGARAPAS